MGDHLIFAWCLLHKLELALHDAFTVSQLETDAQKQLEKRFCPFKKTGLKWRLFKQYATILEKHLIFISVPKVHGGLAISLKY